MNLARLHTKLRLLTLDDEQAIAARLLAARGSFWRCPADAGLTVARDALVVHLDARRSRAIERLFSISAGAQADCLAPEQLPVELCEVLDIEDIEPRDYRPSQHSRHAARTATP